MAGLVTIQAVFDPTALIHARPPLGDELRSVFRSDESRHAAHDEQIRQHIHDISRVELTLNPDRQAFTALLIQGVQCPEDLPVVGSVMHEVVRPDMVAIFRPQSHARPVIQPEPSFLRLLHRHFQPLTPP